MTKKRNEILSWCLLWAGLPIIFLYSPLGSPYLYSSQNYPIADRGATFKSRKIPNAPNVKTEPENNDNGLDIPNPLPSKTNNANNYPPENVSFQESSYICHVPDQLFQNYPGTVGMNGMEAFLIAREGSSAVKLNGRADLSTDVSNTTKQSVEADISGIPAGEGWSLFILFGTCYSLYKNRYLLKKLSSR